MAEIYLKHFTPKHCYSINSLIHHNLSKTLNDFDRHHNEFDL
jgi:hypothetical protein